MAKRKRKSSVHVQSKRAKEEFLKSLQDTADRLRVSVKKLGILAAAESAEAKVQYDEAVKPALEKKLKQARVILGEVEAEGGSAWESMRDSAQSAIDGLKAAYDRAAMRFE